jgi:EAL domain-containing protein (putative c-di-GMP-specific phosphodiesterase class I)
MLHRLADRVAHLAVAVLGYLPAHLKLFINAHPGELADVAQVQQRLDLLRPWSDRVVIEITERGHVLQVTNWRASLELLARAGFRIAVDDLGSGYNSLSVLAELQPAYAKVDMSIVRGIDQDDRKQRLVEMLSRFARATQVQLIVEGIETGEEAMTVKRLGADLLQGFLFGAPAIPAPGQSVI